MEIRALWNTRWLAESAAWQGENITLEQIQQVDQHLTWWRAVPTIFFS